MGPEGQRAIIGSQGDSDCVILKGDLPPFKTLPEDGIVGHPLIGEDGPEDQMGEASSSFQGRTVWEAARVVWCDIFQLEPEVHLVLFSRLEPAIIPEWCSFDVPSSSPQILARLSDVMLRREVGEGSGIKHDDAEASRSQALYEDDVVPPSLDALMAADHDGAIDLTQDG